MEFRKDDQMATRYAVVRVANDAVQSVDRTHLVSIDEEALKELGLRIAQGTATKGWEGSLRYQVAKTDAGTMVVLVDANEKTQQISRLMMVTGAVFVLCIAVVYVLVRLASKRAIRPFVENVERQQQFIANASHEIKTPLAVLSANTDLLAMMGTEAKFVDSNKRQIKRLNSLVEQMLILSRYDEGVAKTIGLMKKAECLLYSVGSAIIMGERRGLTQEQMATLKEKKAIGEAFGCFFDAEGNVVLKIPRVGLHLSDLSTIPHSIAVVEGAEKAPALKAYAKLAPVDRTWFVIDKETSELVLNGATRKK